MYTDDFVNAADTEDIVPDGLNQVFVTHPVRNPNVAVKP
jgi:hypothetical protein